VQRNCYKFKEVINDKFEFKEKSSVNSPKTIVAMKNLKLFTLMPGILLAVQVSFAQSTANLKLSNPYPEKGEKVTFTYDPSGTPLASLKGSLEGTAWCIENGNYPSTSITIQPKGKSFTGEFTVSGDARAFFIKLNKGKIIDDNSGKGYISLIYKAQKPVAGAYASNAFILSSGIGTAYAKIERNTNEAATLYQKEFEQYPESKKQYEQAYYMALSQNPVNAPILNKKIAELKQSKEETDLILAGNLLRNSGNTAAYDSLTKVIKLRHPDGLLALNDVANTIAREKNANKKDSLFKDFLTKYPAAPVSLKSRVITTMLGDYLKSGNMSSYDKYASQVTDKLQLAQVLNGVAWNWAVAGEKLAEAEKYLSNLLIISFLPMEWFRLPD
jgi:hypothetical protein